MLLPGMMKFVTRVATINATAQAIMETSYCFSSSANILFSVTSSPTTAPEIPNAPIAPPAMTTATLPPMLMSGINRYVRALNPPAVSTYLMNSSSKMNSKYSPTLPAMPLTIDLQTASNFMPPTMPTTNDNVNMTVITNGVAALI